MNKELEKNILKELKQLATLELNSGDYFLQNENYEGIDSWVDIIPFFNQLDNITSFMSIDFDWNGDIYSSLRKLENLKEICFYSSDISDTEEYIEKGLEKFPKLEKLWLLGTQLNKFPEIITHTYLKYFDSGPIEYQFPNLIKLGLIGNNFYKQNFNFKLKNDCQDFYKKIEEFGIKKHCKINKNTFEKLDAIKKEKKLKLIEIIKLENEIVDNTYLFKEYPWGLTNWDKTILILQDNFINDHSGINSLSIYILNENQKDRYEIFNTYRDFFTELDKDLDCFKTNDKGDLEMFFYYKNDIYDEIKLEKLKQLQKDGINKYENEFVGDLLIYLGGEQLVVDIANEHIEDDKDTSKEFYNKNHLIQSIRIENFKQFEQETLNELDDINIIVGKNGVGKTSLLQAIAASLIPHKSKDIEKLSSCINLRLKEDPKKPDNLRFARTVVKWGNFTKAQRFFEKEIQLETIDEKENELAPSYLVLAYGENLYAKKHPFKDDKKDYQDILVNGTFQSYFTKSIFTVAYEYMANPLDLLYELSEGRLRQVHKEKWDELLKIAGIIEDKLNKFLKDSTTQKIRIKKDGAYYKFYDKEKEQFLDFDQISEGYRSYIILLTDIIMRILAVRKRLLVHGFRTDEIFKKVKGAIVIDEFDKHMHPSWQRIFLKTLKEEFPKIQFFLSTHNIVSLQSAEGEKVFVLSEKEGKINIEDETLSIGNTVEEIYRIYFDDKIYSEKSGKIIEEFNRLKRLAKVEKNKKYLDEYIKKAKVVKKELNERQSESFSNALNIDIAYLNDFFKKQKNDKNK